MEERINELEEKIEIMEGKLDDIYTVIIGPKLDLRAGFMHRMDIMQKNIEFLTMKFNEFENRVNLEKESAKVKLGIIWYLGGVITSGIVLFLINMALTKKP